MSTESIIKEVNDYMNVRIKQQRDLALKALTVFNDEKHYPDGCLSIESTSQYPNSKYFNIDRPLLSEILQLVAEQHTAKAMEMEAALAEFNTQNSVAYNALRPGSLTTDENNNPVIIGTRPMKNL